MKPVTIISAEFDAIAAALAAAPRADALTPAERWLLRHIPSHAKTALDMGCGDGHLARALARHGLVVTALDVSAGMVALARARTSGDAAVRYAVVDFMAESVPESAFDVVLAVNVVHHMPLDHAVARLAAAVAPGGALLIQDVLARGDVRYAPLNLLAGVRRLARFIVAQPRMAAPAAVLYVAHGKGEVYLKPSEAQIAYRQLLPGVHVRHHLEWRYSAVWHRPS